MTKKIQRLPVKITAAWLRRMGACLSEVERFERVFPKGASVNVESVRLARDAGLDFDWLRWRLGLGCLGKCCTTERQAVRKLRSRQRVATRA